MNGFNESEVYRLARGLDRKSWRFEGIKNIDVQVRAFMPV